jgi:Domain of unknown function (DUF4868)
LTSALPSRSAVDRAISELSDLPETAEVHVVLFSGTQIGELSAQRLNPTSDLAETFLQVARRWAEKVADRTPVAYGPGRVPASYEVAFVNKSAVQGLDDVLRVAEVAVDVELFTPDSPEANSLRFYVVSVYKPNPGWLHFIKAKGATLRLRRTSKIAAVMRGAAYDTLEEDPLLFDASFDAIVAHDVVLITSQSNFQRALNFVEQARQLALETINTLSQQLEIINFDDFSAAASSDLNMVAKLRSIADKMASNPAYAAAMTTERVVAFAAASNIEIDTEEVDGAQKLVFHSEPARRWRILKLLDDDYLHSQLTELDYEVNSKSPLA